MLSRRDLHALSHAALKARCVEAGLQVSGSKGDLAERMIRARTALDDVAPCTTKAGAGPAEMTAEDMRAIRAHAVELENEVQRTLAVVEQLREQLAAAAAKNVQLETAPQSAALHSKCFPCTASALHSKHFPWMHRPRDPVVGVYTNKQQTIVRHVFQGQGTKAQQNKGIVPPPYYRTPGGSSKFMDRIRSDGTLESSGTWEFTTEEEADRRVAEHGTFTCAICYTLRPTLSAVVGDKCDVHSDQLCSQCMFTHACAHDASCPICKSTISEMVQITSGDRIIIDETMRHGEELNSDDVCSKCNMPGMHLVCDNDACSKQFCIGMCSGAFWPPSGDWHCSNMCRHYYNRDQIPDTEESEECARCKKTFRYYLHDCTCDDCFDFTYFVCKDCEYKMEGCGICGKK